MKFLCYGDLQISHRRKEYMAFLDRTLDWLCETITQVKPDFIVNMGDTFDTFGTVDVRDMDFAWRKIRRITEAVGSPEQHIILVGNHDRADKSGDCFSPVIFQEFAQVINMACYYQFRGKWFIMLPHGEAPDKMWAWATNMRNTQPYPLTAAFAHTDWIGCHLTPQYVSKEGLDPAAWAKEFPGVPVFAGHYHNPCKVGPVHFVGAPLHMDFSDQEGEIKRGVLVHDLNPPTPLTGETLLSETRWVFNPHTYHCVVVEAKDKKTLKAKRQGLAPETTRVKVYVPNKLIDDAVELFTGFLWYAVYPLESENKGVEFTTNVKITSTVDEIVSKAVSQAPEGMDRTTLTAIGKEILR